MQYTPFEDFPFAIQRHNHLFFFPFPLGCYGISESHSTASTESSASTEPWFCDACKAGVSPVSFMPFMDATFHQWLFVIIIYHCIVSHILDLKFYHLSVTYLKTYLLDLFIDGVFAIMLDSYFFQLFVAPNMLLKWLQFWQYVWVYEPFSLALWAVSKFWRNLQRDWCWKVSCTYCFYVSCIKTLQWILIPGLA